MGTRSLPLISFPPPTPPRLSINPKSSVNRSPNFCSDFPASYAAATVPRARWGSKFAGDVDGRSGIRSCEKRRKWWSDEDEEEEEDEDDGDDGLFGLWKDPKTIDLVLKGLGTIGWIMPNIIMSSMLDTGDKGQDALIMALMLPLGQLAISLVVDNIQGSSGSRQKRKRKPSARTSSRSRQGNKTRKRSYRTSQERAAYHPWWEADSSFFKNGTKSSSNFGGWDELDQQVDNVSDFNGSPPCVDDNSKKESNVKIE